MALPLRIKVCGVTTPDDAAAVAATGADTIGLNFFAKSPRCVSLEQAREIADASGAALRVGVFVNHSAEQIAAAVQAARLDAIQLHGDEPLSLLGELPEGPPVIRAVRVGPEGLAPAARLLEEADRMGRAFAAVLVDAAAAGAYGGTGKAVDWARIARERRLLGGAPLILAGGLTPENVAEAIRQARPDGVDTASGVESSPGRKDAARAAQFVANAAEAFAALRE